MESKVKLFGHPIHPMLVVFPIGLFATAAIFGFIDWLALPNNSRAKYVGGWHGLGNVVIVVLFAVSWLIRGGNAIFVPNTLAMLLSFAGFALASITAWIRGKLVYRLGVGVDPGANLNAPNSLTEQSASATRTKRTTVKR